MIVNMIEKDGLFRFLLGEILLWKHKRHVRGRALLIL